MFDPVLFAALMGSTALFSPSALFSSGEQGAWYDPSDFSTMFQESTGVTPVTAVEQPVGLILDKSKSLAVGTELVSPINFTTGWTFSGGPVTFDSASTYTAAAVANVYQAFFTVGKWYKLTINVTFTSAAVLLYNATSALNLINQTTIVSGTSYTCYFLAAATQLNIRPTSAGVVTVNSITVQEVAGNHASQSTAASRPVLSARVNLLTQSETPASWTTVGSTVLSKTVTATATTARHGIINPASSVAPANTVCTATVRVTRVNGDFIQVAGSSGGFYANFNISSGVVGTTGGVRVIGSSIALVSAETYDCTVTFTGNADTLWVLLAQTASDGALPSYLAAGTETFVCVRADLRVTNDGVGIPAYQRVGAAVTATTNPAVTGVPDYDTSGFPLYLRFDGTDDSLSTASIDFSATDEMSVFAGLRKLSDIGNMIVELSATTASNNGSFSLNNWSDFKFYWASKGTTYIEIGTAAEAGPLTGVLSGASNISGPSMSFRRNGVQVSSSSASQGTGNYGNYPLYIGRRGGSTLPYNGRLYSLIVRGAQSTDAQIASTETWVNGKTRSY